MNERGVASPDAHRAMEEGGENAFQNDTEIVPEGFEPSAPEPTEVEETENFDVGKFKERIDAADSIDQLCIDLGLTDDLIGSKGVKSADVIRSIREVEEFLDDNMKAILTGVINKGSSHYRDLLGKKLFSVHGGGDLDIRSKVQELLKAKMDSSFKENKAEYVVNAVAQSTSFDQLEYVIKQFRGVNMEGEGGPRITAEEAVQLIEDVRTSFEGAISRPQFLNGSEKAIEDKMAALLEIIPQDSGIKSRVEFLLKERLREAKFESFSSDNASEPQKKSGGGLLGKIRKRFWTKVKD